jgi:hypothetical protein
MELGQESFVGVYCSLCWLFESSSPSDYTYVPNLLNTHMHVLNIHVLPRCTVLARVPLKVNTTILSVGKKEILTMHEQ